MANVIPFLRVGRAQEMLQAALEEDLTEVVIIGKRKSGIYRVWMTRTEKMLEYVGMIELLKHDCLVAVEESPLPPEEEE